MTFITWKIYFQKVHACYNLKNIICYKNFPPIWKKYFAKNPEKNKKLGKIFLKKSSSKNIHKFFLKFWRKLDYQPNTYKSVSTRPYVPNHIDLICVRGCNAIYTHVSECCCFFDIFRGFFRQGGDFMFVLLFFLFFTYVCVCVCE